MIPRPPADLLATVEAYYDAVPRRAARAEQIGPFTLFVNPGPGWRYYVRPSLGATAYGNASVAGIVVPRLEGQPLVCQAWQSRAGVIGARTFGRRATPERCSTRVMVTRHAQGPAGSSCAPGAS